MKWKLIEESSITRLMRHNEEHECVCITAYRSSRMADDKGLHRRKARMPNRVANNALGAALRKMGYNITQVLGQYPEMVPQDDGTMVAGPDIKESSWFVVNVNDDPDFLEKCASLAEKDEQDSILFIPKGSLTTGKGCFLYGTKNEENAWPSYHEKVFTDGISINGDDSIFTKIDGKKFAFSLVNEDSSDYLSNKDGMWSSLAKVSYVKKHYGVDLLK